MAGQSSAMTDVGVFGSHVFGQALMDSCAMVNLVFFLFTLRGEPSYKEII